MWKILSTWAASKQGANPPTMVAIEEAESSETSTEFATRQKKIHQPSGEESGWSCFPCNRRTGQRGLGGTPKRFLRRQDFGETGARAKEPFSEPPPIRVFPRYSRALPCFVPSLLSPRNLKKKKKEKEKRKKRRRNRRKEEGDPWTVAVVGTSTLLFRNRN